MLTGKRKPSGHKRGGSHGHGLLDYVGALTNRTGGGFVGLDDTRDRMDTVVSQVCAVATCCVPPRCT